jgi:hypothetical protein
MGLAAAECLTFKEIFKGFHLFNKVVVDCAITFLYSWWFDILIYCAA